MNTMLLSTSVQFKVKLITSMRLKTHATIFRCQEHTVTSSSPLYDDEVN